MRSQLNLTSAAVLTKQKPHSEIVRAFGVWIKAQRERAGLTQEATAKKAGINTMHLSRIENGGSGTKRDTVIALAGAIRCDVREALRQAGFASDDPIPNRELTVDMILHSGYDELTPEALARHIAQIKRISEALRAADE